MLWGLLIILLTLTYIYFTRNHKYWKKKGVPFKTPLPVFGNFLNLFTKKEGISSIIKNAYDSFSDEVPYFGMFFLETPFLVIKERELMKQVLVKDFSDFPNRPTYGDEYIDPWSTNTLFTLKNGEWKWLRHKLIAIFTPSKMKTMMIAMKEITDQIGDQLEDIDLDNVDVRQFAKKHAVYITSNCLFGVNLKSLAVDTASMIKTMTDKVLNLESYTWILSLSVYFLCPILVKIFNLKLTDQTAIDFIVDTFENSYRKRKEFNIRKRDLLDLLYELREQENEGDLFKFDGTKLAAQAISFNQAGTETTALIFAFCLYELALHKDIQDNVRHEIEEHLNLDITYEKLSDMKYLDMVIKETMRKYPVVPILIRQAGNRYKFEDSDLEIEKGTNVIIPVLAIHRDPKYFPEPEKFDPLRFQNGGKEFKYIYLPFGEGPRKCLGYRFAEISLKLQLSTFLSKFEVSPNDQTQIPLQLHRTSFQTLPDGPLILKLKPIS